ncbi:hypothetical protein CYMTET_21995 [Cymbomonas tetramitiformis]|uniref:Cilia- and flagella-associated protein 43 n=1 Tax=Cymbomonas tetramitiformis TaxID=36881 RepID=A0AAE0L2M7_9CHLO|nr:hypothetical protein CYMTET_21995 [Cymbomonas tetramitiformis]
MNIGVEFALGYHGSPVTYSALDEVAYICGNAIVFHHIPKNEQKYLWGADRGITTFAVSKRARLLAYASKGEEPAVYIHDLRTLQQLNKLTGIAEIEVAALAFSRDGDRILTVGKEPDQKLILWNSREGTKIVETETEVEAEEVSLNAENSDEILVVGSGVCTLYTVDKTYKTFSISARTVDMDELNPITGAWMPGGIIYVGCQLDDGGQLAVIDAKTAQIVPTPKGGLGWVESATPISAVLCHKSHVAVAGGDGLLRFFTHFLTDGSVQELDLLFELPLVAQDEFLEVLSMAYSPLFQEMVVVTGEGTMHKVNLRDAARRGTPQDPEAPFATASTWADYHSGAVTGLVPMPLGTHFATTGVDGTLRIWDGAAKKMVFKREFSSKQTCLGVSAAAGMIALGSSEGVLRLMRINSHGAAEPTLAFRCRVHDSTISHVCFSPSGLVVASYAADGKLFFTSTGMTPGTEPRAMFFTRSVPESVACLTWSSREAPESGNEACDGVILMGLVDGEMMSLQPPLLDTSVGPEMELAKQDVPGRRMRLEYPLDNIIAVPRHNEEAPQVCVTLACDKKLKRFVLPQDAAGWGGPTGRPRAADSEVRASHKRGGVLQLSGNTSYLLHGSTDGTVSIRSATDWKAGSMLDLLMHDSYLGGIVAASFGMSSDYVFTGGKEGAVFICKLTGLDLQHEIPSPPLYMGSSELDLDAYDDPDELNIVDLRKQVKDEAHTEEDSQVMQQESRRSIMQLKDKFQRIRAKNETVPTLEKLEYKEFIIDYQLKDMLEAEGAQKVKEVQMEVKNENVSKELYADRIKSECWTQMTTQGTFLLAFKSGLEVGNFPLRARDELAATLKKVAFLRRVEIREEVYQARVRKEEEDAQQTAEGAEEGAEGAGIAEVPIMAASMEEAPASGEAGEEEDGADEGTEEGMLYNNLDLIGPQRKRTQMLLLEMILEQRKTRFNDKIVKAQDRKSVDIDKISELNERIVEIQKELAAAGVTLADDEVLFRPEVSEREKAGSMLRVSDSEVAVEKYISPAERKRLDEEKDAEEARLRAQAGDDMFERALKNMMGGNLESKNDKENEFELVRPEWMNQEQLTEEQVKLKKDFEAKEKIFKEELDKRKKAMETELKKLRSDVTEVCGKFDETLGSLHMEWLVSQANVYELEMQIIKLASALEQSQESDEQREAELIEELEELKVKKGKSTSVLAEFKREVDVFKEAYDALVVEDKALDKGFKKEFAECEEFVDALYKLFKRRQRPKNQEESDRRSPSHRPSIQVDTVATAKGAGARMRRSSKARISRGGEPRESRSRRPSNWDLVDLDAVADMHQARHSTQSVDSDPFHRSKLPTEAAEEDPFQKGIGAKTLQSTEPKKIPVDPLDPYLDRPEGVDLLWWDRLVDARTAKISSEEEVNRHGAVLKEMTKYLQMLTDDDEQSRTRIEEILRELKEFREERARNMYDLEVPVKLKQGQIEIDLEGATMDLGEAVLLHRHVVEDVNEVIKKHGGNKVDTLTAIKDFKKGIYDVQWLNKKLDMNADDLIEKTKEFQLLRVTKNLQEFLKNGEDTANAAEVVALEARLEHNRRLQEKNIEERRLQMRKHARNLKEKRLQNYEIQVQIEDMDHHVAEQKRIREGQEKQGVSRGTNNERRMRSLVTQRKLVDIAKAQGEEMVLLREELERLRLRTFPSFVEKRQPGSPDHKNSAPRGAVAAH